MRAAASLLRGAVPALCFTILVLVAHAAFAQGRPAVIVDPGKRQVFKAAVQRFADHSKLKAGDRPCPPYIRRQVEPPSNPETSQPDG